MKIDDLGKIVAVLETQIEDDYSTLVLADKGKVLFKASEKSFSFRNLFEGLLEKKFCFSVEKSIEYTEKIFSPEEIEKRAYVNYYGLE